MMLPAMPPDAQALASCRVLVHCHTSRASHDARAPSHHATPPLPRHGAQVDRLVDHALACPRTGLLARRAKVVERAWVRVAHEAVDAEGQVVPQQWLVHHGARSACGGQTPPIDVVIYEATPNGSALCCNATLVSPLTRTGQPQPCPAYVDGAALRAADDARRPRSSKGRRSSWCLAARSEGASTVTRSNRARAGPTAVPQSAAGPARRRAPFRRNKASPPHGRHRYTSRRPQGVLTNAAPSPCAHPLRGAQRG